MTRSHFRLIAALLAGSIAGTAGAAQICRSPDVAAVGKGEILVRVSRRVPATFVFSGSNFAGATISLHGHVCDRDGEALSDFKLRVARFEGELPEGRALSVEDFSDAGGPLVLLDDLEVTTARDGSLFVPVLGPGKYVLLPLWNELGPEREELSGVIYDLRKTYSATLLSQL